LKNKNVNTIQAEKINMLVEFKPKNGLFKKYQGIVIQMDHIEIRCERVCELDSFGSG
jgi:hypothetical protein